MKLIFLAIVFFAETNWASVKIDLTPESGKLEFLALGNPGFLKINGKGEGPEGTLEITDGKMSGEISIKLSSLDTGMGLRNKHMKEKYLESEKYPKAKLIIKDQAVPLGWSPQTATASSSQLQAELELHGVRKPVSVQYQIDENANLKADFKIKITDYQVEIPSFMGVTVADNVEVKVVSQIKGTH